RSGRAGASRAGAERVLHRHHRYGRAGARALRRGRRRARRADGVDRRRRDRAADASALARAQAGAGAAFALKLAAGVLDSSCPGLTRASIEKSASLKRMDCRVISAFTRVFRRAMPGNDGWMAECQPPFVLFHGVSHPLADGAPQHVEIGAHEERFALAFAEVAVISVDHGAHLDDAMGHGLDDQIAEIGVALLEAGVDADAARDAFGRRA